jgi:hypothetical protein
MKNDLFAMVSLLILPSRPSPVLVKREQFTDLLPSIVYRITGGQQNMLWGETRNHR